MHQYGILAPLHAAVKIKLMHQTSVLVCNRRTSTFVFKKALVLLLLSLFDLIAFSALTLLVERQEGLPACKKWGMVEVGTG